MQKTMFDTFDRRGIVVKYGDKEYVISGDTVMLNDNTAVTPVILEVSDEQYLLIETLNKTGLHQKVVSAK